MNVLMIGVDKTSVGGMLTVVNNYLNNEEFCKKTNLKYISTVIRGNKFKKFFTFIKKIPLIKKTIKKGKIDIVHVHMAERGSVFREGFVVWMAKKMGCKTVIHMHGATIEDWYNRQYKCIKRLVRKIFCLCDCMLVLGENWAPFMKSVMVGNEEKVKVLYNAVSVPNKNIYNMKAKNILFYGMLINRKGIDDLLKAFKLIEDKLPKDVNLVLYGDDHDADMPIQEKIHKINSSRIIYKGWMKKENMNTIFSNTILNVLPSYNEGLPMTILESMSYGIPNISTNIAAIPEAIENNVNGIIINPGDISALSNSILNIVNDFELRKKMSNNSYNISTNKFSIVIHMNKLIEYYDELLKIKEK